MIDFLMISTRSTKRGAIEIYPKFIIKKSSDLMIRGGDFYAIWIEERGLGNGQEIAMAVFTAIVQGILMAAGVNGAGKSTLYEALNELKGMPRINTDEIVKERVKIRINKGGHGISEEDIERRYVETFKNLKDVLKYCDLAAFYDNTKNFHRFAIFRNGEIARISTILPTWFKEKELVCSTNLSVSVSNKLL